MRGSFALVFLLATAAVAHAQSCEFEISNINFGTLSFGSAGSTTSGTVTGRCSGTPNQTIAVCANIGAGSGGTTGGSPRYLKQGSSTLPFDLLQQGGQIWGSYLWPYPQRAPTFTVELDGSGTGSLSQNIDAQVAALPTASLAGGYQSIFGAADAVFDYGYAPTHSCAENTQRAKRLSFRVSAQNPASCTVSSTPLNFGTISTKEGEANASNQISVLCTNGVRYAVGLSSGANSSGSDRNLRNASTGKKLRYSIYQDPSHSQPWGNTTGTDTVSGTSNGDTQTFPAYGHILLQTTPSPGRYTDRVIVTVNY